MHPERTRRTGRLVVVRPAGLSAALERRLGLQVLFDFPDIVEAVEFASGQGFGAVELNLGNLEFSRQLTDARGRRRVRTRAERLGIRLAVHAVEGASLFVPDRAVLRFSIRTVKLLLDRAADAGIENVVMHLGFEMAYSSGGRHEYPHEYYPEFYAALVGDALAELKEHARGRARLCIENVGGFRFEFVHRALDKLLGGNLGLCYDIGHNAILPGPARRAEAELYRRHARRVYHSHLHDNRGRQDEHLPLGRGSIKLASYLRFLVGTPALLCVEVRPRAAAVESRDYLLREVLARG